MDFRRSDRSGRPVDRAEAERLLDAAAAPAAGDADPLARLLHAAAAPSRPAEMAGEEAALAAFRSARAAGPAADPPRRRRGITTGLVTWVAGIVTLAAAGVAFAAVTRDRPADPQPPAGPPASLPEPAAVPADGGDSGGPTTPAGGSATAVPTATPVGVPSPGATSGQPTPTGTPALPVGPSASASPGVPAGDPRFRGQCRAYLAKSARQREKILTTPAFVDLVAAAGGADRVEAYCQRLLDSGASASQSPTADPTGVDD
ncbi:hypothetical protein E1165_03980 [Micromonospora sp. KC723]|nr:hypothetical protein E1165_03980 [Micromonospora sp. KC723]